MPGIEKALVGVFHTRRLSGVAKFKKNALRHLLLRVLVARDLLDVAAAQEGFSRHPCKGIGLIHSAFLND